MFRELVSSARELPSVSRLVDEVLPQIGKGITDSASAVSSFATRAAHSIAGGSARSSNAGTTPLTAAKSISPNELIDSSIKKIGSDFFSLSESTSLLKSVQVPISDPRVKGYKEAFSQAEVATINRYAGNRSLPGMLIQSSETARLFEVSEPASAVYSAAPSLERLVTGLRDGIKENRWSTVIADDVSGRVPGLLAWDQMQRWSHHRNLPAPQMYFMAGGYGRNKELDASEKLAKLSARMEEEQIGKQPGRVLLVTDTIAGGRGIEPLIHALRMHDTKFDLASVSFLRKDPGPVRTALSLTNDVQFIHGQSSTAALYTGGVNSGLSFRNAVGVEKQDWEATTYANRKSMESVALLRRELVPISRHTFEKVFQ